MNRSVAQISSAAITGAAIGALGGSALGGGLIEGGWLPGLITGATAMGALSGWLDSRREPASPQPLAGRIVASALLAAGIGSAAGWLLPGLPVVVTSTLFGAFLGLLGVRPLKIALGALVGAVVGAGFAAAAPSVGWSVALAVTTIVYRTAAARMWSGRDQIRFRGERVAPAMMPYVVPFAERTRYVGVDYLKRYAESVGASFERSPADIGIIASFDDLAGTSFDPAAVDPLVREFYEHTSRFRLSIVPEWRWWMRLPYRLYRELVAKPLGQANAPFDQTEVQDGLLSWIDTIDVDRDGIPDFRAWVRAYRAGTEPLYVGIYTVQHIADQGYVSVGFPLPSGSFTATLRPTHTRTNGMLLTSHDGGEVSGHYLSVIEDSGDMTVLELTSFGEEIEVYVEEGELRTDQRFSLGGLVFMTLHYTIERTPSTLPRG